METKSETLTATNGASVEVGTIVHNGREYAATGSIVDDEGGYIVGYVDSPGADNISNCAHLTTWNGAEIGVIVRTGTARGFYRTRLYCYSMVRNGYRWHGRGQGHGWFCGCGAERLSRREL